jgi:16S rRNA (uracil1498-N3)-methyltransferase
MVWPRKNIFAEYTHRVPPRFYVPQACETQSTVELPQDEAAHLTRVLRLDAGDEIRVFNGRGDEWAATVRDAGRHAVRVSLDERVTPAREMRVRITLAAAVLKGDKMNDVVRDAVMLGVAAIQPVVTQRSETSVAALSRGRRVERWQRIVVASAKQCGRAVVPPVNEAAPFEDVLSSANVIMLTEPALVERAQRLVQVPTVPAATLLVGPEGGWTQGEVQRAVESGATLLTLGSHTLRADAAPLVALTALRVRWEDF